MELRKRDESSTKEFVNVIAVHYSDDGRTAPIRIQRANGATLCVSKVLECRRAASLRAGGTGIRYYCRVANAEDGLEFRLYLFNDVNYWFIEINEEGSIICVDDTIPM